jgi:ferredoxin/nitrate reductase gamma subunit
MRVTIHTVDPKLSEELNKYGAFDINACFNCGNCSAVCNLSVGQGSFPRRLIRYGQLGMKDKLLSSKETWLCWGCRDCSRTCPRQARPSEYVEAVRRYTVSSYDPTTLSRRLYTSPAFTAVFSIFLAIAFALLLMSGGGTMPADRLALFQFVPFGLIHNIGLVLITGLGLIALWNVIAMVRRVSRTMNADVEETGETGMSTFSRVVFATKELIAELVAQKRFRSCEQNNDKPVVLRPWFVHYTIMWGFVGLLLATVLDFLFKDPNTAVAIYSPVRLLGTLAGLALTYGMIVTMIRKINPADTTVARMAPSDWLFMWLLLAAGVLGFLVETAVYLPQGTLFGYVVFVAHVALAIELLILFPLTKFAHVIYRPLALWLLKYQEAPAAKVALETVEEAA